MNLIIDIGNTNVKIAFFKAGELVLKEFVNYDDVIEFLNGKKFNQGLVANVGNQQLLDEILSAYPFIFKMSSELKLPIRCMYESKQTLGNDRLANAVGAFMLYPKNNSLVIDAGSCLTYDFIDSNDCYIGGAISPGINMRFKSLKEFTENLPKLDYSSVKLELIGKNTETSITSGVINGAIAEINYLIEQYKQSYENLNVIITGGDTSFINSIAVIEKNSIFAHENLTLLGLNTILNYNAK